MLLLSAKDVRWRNAQPFSDRTQSFLVSPDDSRKDPAIGIGLWRAFMALTYAIFDISTEAHADVADIDKNDNFQSNST